jgi:hypothetical protein
MKYKTSIRQEGGKFVGYAIKNEEVVYTTNLHQDPIMVTRELSRYIAQTTQSSVPPITAPKTSSGAVKQPFLPNNAVPVKNRMLESPIAQTEAPEAPNHTVVTTPAPRRCCGRG